MCKGVFAICFQIKIKANIEKRIFLKADNYQVWRFVLKIVCHELREFPLIFIQRILKINS
ncbi:hypothetical protein B0A63_22620 [Flavobacterium johnsoniae UW101]|nr:hypothetical protein B0A63_22620 [Flavobacterium johnsoniae UW101]